MPRMGSAPTATSATTAPSPIPSCAIDYDPEVPAADPGARLRPAQPARHLHQLDRPPRAVPRLSARTARPSGPRLSGRGQRRRVGERNPLPLCARRQRPRPGRHSHRRAVALVPIDRAGPHRRRDRRRRLGHRRSTPTRPLALFDGPRTDFSLARLQHYTGTPAEHFQHFVLFTNYVRYVDEFVRFAIDALRDPDSRFTGLSVPGGMLRARRPDRRRGADRRRRLAAAPDAGLSPDRAGRRRASRWSTSASARPTPRRSATISRCCGPKSWLMIGHCGGLRPSQTIGDYVLAHAYLRDDHVLDDVLPVEIPIPAIAEVQTALFDAALTVTGEDEDSVKKRLRTGTVVTTDDRNWELRYTLVGAALQPEPRGGDRHGIGDRRRPGLSLPRALRDAAVRLRQAAPRRTEAARPGQCLLRARDQPAPPDRHRDARPAAAAKATACTAASCAASTSRRCASPSRRWIWPACRLIVHLGQAGRRPFLPMPARAWRWPTILTRSCPTSAASRSSPIAVCVRPGSARRLDGDAEVALVAIVRLAVEIIAVGDDLGSRPAP